MTDHVTRLAPSPTGALHLGNARTFLLNYLLAHQHGWRVLMRVEDLDSPRVKPNATDRMLEELSWLGLRWERPIVYQSRRSYAYERALKHLIDIKRTYPCICSRKDIAQSARAPHREDGGAPYPGTCRGRFESDEQVTHLTDRPPAWRVSVDGEPIVVRDRFCGEHRFRLEETCGDFVIFRNNAGAGYQLAVVVDDAATKVNCVVRGDDLLESAARQILLYRLLDLSPIPQYWHLPLVVGSDGRRLAKRHGDTRLDYYRRHAASSQRVLGLLGYWCGMLDRRGEVSMEELLRRFDLERVPREPIVFTTEDDNFLLGK